MEANSKHQRANVTPEIVLVVVLLLALGGFAAALESVLHGSQNHRHATDEPARDGRVDDEYIRLAFRYLTNGSVIANRQIHHCALPPGAVNAIKAEQLQWEARRSEAAAGIGDAQLIVLSRERAKELRDWVQRYPRECQNFCV